MTAFVWSCKSVAYYLQKNLLAKVDLKLLGKEIDKASTRIKTFRARVKAEYKDGKQQHQVEPKPAHGVQQNTLDERFHLSTYCKSF